MRVLVVGSLGNMGRRYAAILKHLGHEVVGVDVGTKIPSKLDAAIVATPTDTHYGVCKVLSKKGYRYLCEKPVSKSPKEIESLMRYDAKYGGCGYMVNNWARTLLRYVKPNSQNVYYDCWNTGKDGLLWDCIQLVYLAKGRPHQLESESPTFSAWLGTTRITLGVIELSYIAMVRSFLEGDDKRLWTLQDALAATQKVRSMLCR